MPYYKGTGLQTSKINLENPITPVTTGGKGLQMYQQNEGSALNYAKSMDQNIEAPGKTIGGGLTSGLMGAGAGTAIGGLGPGTAIGGIVGMAGYYLS